jgi:nitrate reductase assembly molybdenum cofactor insertion protein NarJ
MPFYCRVLSLALDYPSEAQRRALAEAIRALATVASVEECKRFEKLALEGSVQDWAEQHTALFGSAGLFPLELCFHLTDNPFEQARRLGEIAGSYRAFGLDVPEGRRHDEVPLLLDFLGALELKADRAAAQGEMEKAAIASKAAAELVEGILAPGLQALLVKLRTANADGYFPPLLEACLEVVRARLGAPSATAQ